VTGLRARPVMTHAGTSYDAARIFPDSVFWIEGRADGRDVLVRWSQALGSRDVTPAGHSVASTVHEYGGGAWTTAGSTTWFCDADSQRLYRVTRRGTAPADPPPPRPAAVRYADLHIDPGGQHLWSVRERHEHNAVVNELVRIPLTAAPAPRIAASGWDFYASPRPSPDGRLAWICWNAPQMPWDGTYLHIAGIGPDGVLGPPALVAGGPGESVSQPQWSPAGILHFISDRHGWWGLYAWHDGETIPVLAYDAELGVAQWEFGYSTYAFLDSGRIAVIAQQGARQSLEVLEHGRLRRVDLPYTSIKPYLTAHGNKVALIASSPAEAPSVVIADVDAGPIRTISGAAQSASPEPLSQPEPFTFTARDGTRIHGLLYQPRRSAGIPPLVVKAHPGPTASTTMRLDWHTQSLCSEGFAVAEIDYRGSTGYGRAYRDALRGQWGEHDALDCADGAEYLAGLGRTDPRRTVIWGASAGGYTALRALIRTRVFAACIARSPVIDPRTWRKTAPKFQAHHADGLIGPWPQAAALYQARSVLEHAGEISRPVLLLHGEQDRITPAAQSRALARALGDQALLIAFPDEGHSLRSPQAQQRALEAELGFLSEVVPDR